MTPDAGRRGSSPPGWVRPRGRWLAGAAGYVALVGGLAGAGDTRSAAPLLAAVMLTLPLGVAAFVGVYVVYGVLFEISRALGARVMAGNGWGPVWFVVVDEVVVTAMFVVAAAANALLLREVLRHLGGARRRRAR